MDKRIKQKFEKSTVLDRIQDEVKIVVFSLGEEIYGLKIDQVKEIIGFAEYTPIPNAPDYILGLIDLRGEVVILVDLQKRFELEEKNKDKKHIIVCQGGEGRLGVAVDNVQGIIGLNNSDIKDAEDMIKRKISPEYLSGIAVYNKKVLVVLNIDKLIQKEDLKKISLHRDSTEETEKPKIEE